MLLACLLVLRQAAGHAVIITLGLCSRRGSATPGPWTRTAATSQQNYRRLGLKPQDMCIHMLPMTKLVNGPVPDQLRQAELESSAPCFTLLLVRLDQTLAMLL